MDLKSFFDFSLFGLAWAKWVNEKGEMLPWDLKGLGMGGHPLWLGEEPESWWELISSPNSVVFQVQLSGSLLTWQRSAHEKLQG